MDENIKKILHEMSLNQYKNGIRKIINGHEIFKMNIEDGIISKADGTISTEYDKFNRPYKKINIEFKVGYIYIPTLNLNNAHKKVSKILRYIDNKIKEAHNFALLGGSESTNVNI